MLFKGLRPLYNPRLVAADKWRSEGALITRGQACKPQEAGNWGVLQERRLGVWWLGPTGAAAHRLPWGQGQGAVSEGRGRREEPGWVWGEAIVVERASPPCLEELGGRRVLCLLA